MKFSIIIPVYNAQRYLRECIRSVLDQTCQDYEIILVNDGSADLSGEICDQYHNADPGRVQVIHAPNRGALAARFTGIQNAGGEILLFLDADDRLRRDSLEILARAMEQSGSDLVLFNGSVSEQYDRPFIDYPFPDGAVYTRQEKEPVYRALVGSCALNNVWLKAAKRALFAGEPADRELPRIRHGEDLLMSAQMIEAAEKILVLDQNLYFYRQNDASIVHSSQRERASSIKQLHLLLEARIPRWNLPELIPLHRAREVRGWVETLKLLARELSPREYKETVRSMSADPYFRNAYEKMDGNALDWKDRLLSGLLYRNIHWAFALLRILCR